MSTPNPPPTPAAAKPAPAPVPPPKPAPHERPEVRVISHCTLFYWWPVWACGFIMFVITMWEGHQMVTVPPGTTAKFDGPPFEVEGKKKGEKIVGKLHVLELPPEKELPKDPDHPGQPLQPHLRMSESKNLGVVFIAVLLLVIIITNVPMRGLWSAVVIGLVIVLVLLFAWLKVWDTIFTWVSWLDIRINAAGYLVISVVLLVLWLVTVFVFDHRTYVVLAPGILRVRREIGGAEDDYDTTGMRVQKLRNDIFRHWILGLFNMGDLIIKPAGAEEIHMPNVWRVSKAVDKIQGMLQIKEVEAAPKTAP
jgi:hypothetical protein